MVPLDHDFNALANPFDDSVKIARDFALGHV
jgi:hypothetical protein